MANSIHRRSFCAGLLSGLLTSKAFGQAMGSAQMPLVLGLQEGGTAQWEIAAMQSLGLDAQHGLALEIRPLVDSRAGQIALQARAVDVILSDFVYVSTQRHRGTPLTMVPHSLTVGGLMTPADSAIVGVESLKGKRLAVAGSPVDKSWVVLQALYATRTGGRLAEEAEIRFGAAPLVHELLLAGQTDAGLNFWQWNARGESAGLREALSVRAMLEGLGIASPPPLLGWTFSEDMDEGKRQAVHAFLDASFETKARLLTDDAVWAGLEPLMRTEGNDALFERLKAAYREGIVSAYAPEDTGAAEALFAVLKQFGGEALTGGDPSLATGTFYRDYRREG